MATARREIKDVLYLWEGVDKKGRKLKGDMRAPGEAVVQSMLRRQGITVTKVKKQSSLLRGKRITDKDITLFTRQLATMMKAGVPLLQSFDIVQRGTAIPPSPSSWAISGETWKPAAA